MLQTIVIFCVILFVYAEEISPGRCPRIILDTQLNLSKVSISINKKTNYFTIKQEIKIG